MKYNIFREYDIRGIIGEELPIDDTYDLAQAIVTYYLKQNSNIKNILIGMDGRLHSPAIKENMTKAITDLGLNVIDIGVCTTPVLYFSLFNHPKSFTGFIITASHNPKDYNGIKICLDKKIVWGKQIQEIKKIVQEKNFYKYYEEKKGNIETYDATSEYIKWLLKAFSHLKNLEIAAIIDCGNGTAGTVVPRLVNEMGWKNIKFLYEEVDGAFPNHEADPTKSENMKDVFDHLKKDPKLELGIGFDGDCDRMSPVTKDCYLVPGDKLLAVFSKQVLKNHPAATVVFDIKSSSGLIEFLEKWNAKPIMAPSGHSKIKDIMQKQNALLAGELSCHFFFKDRYFGYDDGVYAMMRLFEILHETNKTLSELIAEFPQKFSTPEYRLTCKEENKHLIVDHVISHFANKKNIEILTIDGIRAQMSYGWGLVRASNTQPVISLRFESDTEEGLRKVKWDFTQALKLHLDVNFLEIM
ncbi:phosphomannomutase/phosphoglucomutase [Candidatus Babeliales bacterium]|nr:phosphomannomutase/phosphoglucomutase [Candidatus Babeliales bacterium]